MISNVQEIGFFIEKMTTDGSKQLDQNLMKKVKHFCKQSNEFVEQVFRMTKIQLEKPHSQIRYSSLLIIDELFLRSHKFRSLLLINENLQKFFELTLGIDEDKPLPPPKKFASDLKKKSIELIESWNKKFAEGYPSLKSAFNYLKTSTVNFTERQIIQQAERQAKEEKEAKKLQLQKEKIIKKSKEFEEFKTECKSILTQANNCLNLLYPDMTFDESCDSQYFCDQNNFSNIICKELSVSIKHTIELNQVPENEIVIENMKDIYNHIANHFLPKLKNIIKDMSKEAEYCSENIKIGIDLKNEFIRMIKKYLKLKIIDTCTYEKKKDEFQESSSDSDFEEVGEKEELELIIPQHWRKEYGLYEEKNLNSPSSSNNNSNVRMCKFPLSNGKLCPRQDKIKCPFHGKIIDRNELGIALNKEDYDKEIQEAKKEKNTDWQNPIFLKEIEAQIGIDLTIKQKRKLNSCKRNKSLLQNVKTCDQTSRDRLKKKIFSKASKKKVCDSSNLENKVIHSHFNDQWNYALEN